MKRNEELRQQRAKVADDMQVLIKEFYEDKKLAQGEYDERMGRLDVEEKRLRKEIEDIERVEAIAAETRAQGTTPEAEVRGRVNESEAEQLAKRYAQTYERYLRFGFGALDSDQRILMQKHRSQEPVEMRTTLAAEGTPTGGAYPGSTTGFFVPVGFQNEIETAMKWYGSMLNGGKSAPRIITTATGQPLPYPTVNDTTVSGALIGENTQVSTVSVNIGQILLGSYKFTSNLVLVSIELLQDSAFDLNEYLRETFAIRLGRALNTYMTVGTGSSQPNGIVTGATQAQYGGSNYTAVGASGNDGSSAANTIGTDDLIILQHSVDPSYRLNAAYMMHDATLGSMRRLKDKYGRPLWQVSVAEGTPDAIDGKPFFINNDMATLQTAASSPAVSNKTMLFGDLTKYLVRRVKDMTILRLEERYADYGQVGFLAFARYDGNLIDAGTHPVQYLVNTY